jgi:hypothetical protein
VAHRNIAADHYRMTSWIEPAIVGYMDDTTILDIATGADLYRVNIAPHNRERPDGCLCPDLDITYHHGGGIDPHCGIDLWL